MKKEAALLLGILLIVYGCAQDGTTSKEKTAEERLSEGDYDDITTDHMVPGEYGLLEQNIDILLQAGNMIGDRHYDELEASVNRLERQGVDVSELREKLARLIVAPGNGEEKAYDEHDENIAPNMEQEEFGHEPAFENGGQASSQNFKIGLLSPRGCEGNGSFMLGTSPIALEDLQKILPMGIMSSVHITPTDHQYFHTMGYFGPGEDTQNLDRFRIYAPGDGYIVDIEKGTDHRIVIEHSCTFYTIFIHVDRLSDKVKSYVDFRPDTLREHAWPRIPVKEGEVIGTIGIGKFDFSVVDASVSLKGFVKPESYEGEVWKIHTVDTFDYFKEPVKSELLKKNLRKIAPYGGKIDYDIDGKLVGSWFLENTNGYRGLGNENYWTTHLSIVYDGLDPNNIIVSIGDFGGRSGQFGVSGNAPNPKDIGVESKVVKYELVPYDYYSGNEKWSGINYAENIKAKNTDDVRGTALFELAEERKLKAEFFVGKKANEVSGFTGNAKVYER
ncbi:hypothetical protein HYS31_03430 [Candidatus Woesearchaeota archaeon]|nr:hypothetical protein [Candidatus Woesearchaeota archaeon]